MNLTLKEEIKLLKEAADEFLEEVKDIEDECNLVFQTRKLEVNKFDLECVNDEQSTATSSSPLIELYHYLQLYTL